MHFIPSLRSAFIYHRSPHLKINDLSFSGFDGILVKLVKLPQLTLAQPFSNKLPQRHLIHIAKFTGKLITL